MADRALARKPSQPYRAGVPQDWSGNQIEASHEEALYGYGEYSLFTLMWRPPDYDAGRVDHCQTCFGAQSRQAAAFQQPIQRNCPDCYGTTFEGGFRAQIVRPSIWADRNNDTEETRQGVVTPDTLLVETTSDFTFHRGDYIFRFDNARYQAEEKNEAVLRTGFNPPNSSESFSGAVTAHLEDPTSVAYLIPPIDPVDIATMLDIEGPHTALDLDALTILRPNGYL